MAAQNGYEDVVEVLLENDARPNAARKVLPSKRITGKTPIQKDQIDCFDALMLYFESTYQQERGKCIDTSRLKQIATAFNVYGALELAQCNMHPVWPDLYRHTSVV
jgi:hypothetical protein